MRTKCSVQEREGMRMRSTSASAARRQISAISAQCTLSCTWTCSSSIGIGGIRSAIGSHFHSLALSLSTQLAVAGRQVTTAEVLNGIGN